VRLVAENGDQLGIVAAGEALRMAEEQNVDLVEIAPLAVPPVCKLMDYGKFRYREQKKAHEAKLKQKQIQVKEIKFRPGTDEGDYKIKLGKLVQFLEEGDKAKVTLRFRGREMAHKEFGERLLERVKKDLDAVGLVEQFPRLEGRQMMMVLAPKKKAQPEKAKAKPQAEGKSESAASGGATHGPPGVRLKRSSCHAEDEDEEGRGQAVQGPRQRQHQARERLYAAHPHEEEHQAQAPAAPRQRGAPDQHARDPRNAAVLVVRSAPCRESNVESRRARATRRS
jgi:translation initiation factor IF-3